MRLITASNQEILIWLEGLYHVLQLGGCAHKWMSGGVSVPVLQDVHSSQCRVGELLSAAHRRLHIKDFTLCPNIFDINHTFMSHWR